MAEASSLAEALDICASYQIPGTANSGGHGEPTRVATLTPWVRCLEAVFQRFPESMQRQELVMLFRALESRRAGTPTPEAKTVDWQAMNFAMARALDHIKAPKPYSAEERRVLELELSSFALFIAEQGAFSTKPVPKRTKGAKVDREDQIGSEETNLPAEKIADTHSLGSEQRSYCRQYKAYTLKANNLRELEEYKRILEERTYRDSHNTNELAMRSRVSTRVANLQLEVQGQKAILEKQLKNLQSRSHWFQNGYCR